MSNSFLPNYPKLDEHSQIFRPTYCYDQFLSIIIFVTLDNWFFLPYFPKILLLMTPAKYIFNTVH